MFKSFARGRALIFAVGLTAAVLAACTQPAPGGGGTPTTIPAAPAVEQVASAGTHTCALINDGTVYCWGANNYGQLGDGTLTLSTVPVQVVGIDDAVEVAASLYSACARLADGTVSCWGRNNDGQLGDGTTTDSPAPVPVSGVTTATQLSTGGSTACALLADTTVQCWGSGRYGQLGNGTPDPNPTAPTPGNIDDVTNIATTPVAVSGLSGVTKVSMGPSTGCAVINDGTVKCWGRNYNGELGAGFGGKTENPDPPHPAPYSVAEGNDTLNQTVPVNVVGITNAVDVVAQTSSCAVLADGTVKCWGRNVTADLGIGTDGVSTNTNQPTDPVIGISNAVEVSGGSSRCARLADGTVKCWANNASGQAGDGTTGGYLSTPVAVSGITDAVSVVSAGQHACAALASGAAVCWGGASGGKLGNGTTSPNQPTPVAVSGLPPA